ncbi:MAG: hypothetical protein ABIQ59_16615, partial [Nocardioidaceae bacterium]
ATLVCATNPVSASSGVVTFGGCKVDKTGSYTLTAAASGLTSGTSASVTITAGPAATLVFTAAPPTGSASSNANIGPFTIQVQDAAGNPAVSSGSTSVSLSAATSGSGSASFATTSGAAGSATLVLVIPAGTSASSFYFGWSKANRSPVITATSGSLSNGTTTVTVN